MPEMYEEINTIFRLLLVVKKEEEWEAQLAAS